MAAAKRPARATPSVKRGQPAKHVPTRSPGAQTRPADFFPHKEGQQVTATAGMNPDPPANRQAAMEIRQNVPYSGDSPTGYDPYTLGTL
jgi:hypothetical protein